ncbi:MAG: hypothetical protein CO140_04750 [Candidatus Moranbacteria bacterium CG_4_9_14_3_um_filter_40_7]|nr:MAG: hypothetical protein COX31_00745 [Candidatus Moranbacteria bacterium CG23_combo_of_CG06-09_8_20_14_all_40_16]PIU80376.1 MAG: hypothetical protein COS71_03745 [Candidatus Moranbacteria bacterium CG06_land_8_20_14_3_00_40_12]PJA87362.1 MAG: hypothetical protein CO140_04750 [Candidatus Moranbacteria bacterium CG_4_9_14_3_um_filter_40_7]
MTLRFYLWVVKIVTLFSFSALILVIYFIDPEKTGRAGKIIFYLVLFFALSGLLNLILTKLRKIWGGEKAVILNISLSSRQSVLLSVILIGLLILQSSRILVWWTGLLLIAGVFLIELYFLDKK